MRGSIKWFANNHVAANLIMLTVFVLGLMTVLDARKELIPNVSLERISVQTVLPGSPASVVELNVCKPIEDRIYDIEGTLDLISHAYEGVCSITIDVAEGHDIQEVMDEIKSRLQEEGLLPKDALLPEVKALMVRNRVAKLIVSGNTSYETLLKTARNIKQELLNTKKISVIDLEDIKDSKIKVEVPSHHLKQFNLTLANIGSVINSTSESLAGGRVNTEHGEILIVADQNIRSISDFENIVIRSNDDGGRVLLGDIALITDNRVQNTSQATFNGQPAVSMDVYRVGGQNITDIAVELNDYVGDKSFSSGLSLIIWQDDSKHFSSRISLLLKNALGGLLLLFAILVLFLNFRLSSWVSLGIPFSFFGSLMILPMFDVSINIISLFAFILVLGIVVDDAVVVGESIHEQNQKGLYLQEGALKGVFNVYKPVVFAIATSVVAFLPLLFLPGPEGKLMKAIPIVVISTLLFSLFESLYILPAHLSNNKKVIKLPKLNVQGAFGVVLDRFINNTYHPFLLKSLKRSGTLILFFWMLFIVFIVIVSTGWIKTSLFSAIEGDVIVAKVTLAEGTQKETTIKAVNQLNKAAYEMKREHVELGESIEHIYSVIGARNKVSNLSLNRDLDHIATVTLALNGDVERTLSGQQIISIWREYVGAIDGVEEVVFNSSLNPSKPDIHIELSGNDIHTIKQVADRLKRKLAEFNGVYEIQDSLKLGKQQARLLLKNSGRQMGLSLDQVLDQVNGGFEGVVIQKLQTKDDEVDVWLGLPKSEQASMWHLENFPVHVTDETYVNLSAIMDIQYYQSESTIKRYDRSRVVSVSAFVDSEITNASIVKRALTSAYLDDLVAGFDDVSWSQGGQQKSISEFINILSKSYLIAILVMYLMMAILFSSYSQPILVLLAIPFGLVGSLVGHMLLGIDLTLWSFVGMVAVSGVVVNDNLVLLDFINNKRRQGSGLLVAVSDAGKNRFRPILLTSLTTFIGLLPLILETSIQAQFLIPMAVSLAFGVLFATVVSLFLVPCSYVVLDSLNHSIMYAYRRAGDRSKHIETIDEAYSLGFEQGGESNRRKINPFVDDVLGSSWEAGWHDANKYKNTVYDTGVN